MASYQNKIRSLFIIFERMFDVMKKKLIQLIEKLTAKMPNEMPPIEEIDMYHANFSGGADSIATALILKYGYKIPSSKLRLVHFRVDAQEEAFFDWPETDEYLKYASKTLDIPLIVLRGDKSLRQRIEDRGKFPGAATQYCTSYQKRDLYSKWVRSLGPGTFICASGERRLESSRRSKKEMYQVYKPANAPTKHRFVHWLRPVIHLSETEVWQLMELAGIEPHPCYTKYKVSRCSCKFCIFLSPKEMKTVAEAFWLS